MKTRMVAIATTLGLLLIAYQSGHAQGMGTQSSGAAGTTAGITVTATSAQGGTRLGTLRIDRFERRGSKIYAVGWMNGGAYGSGSTSGGMNGNGSMSASGSNGTSSVTTNEAGVSSTSSSSYGSNSTSGSSGSYRGYSSTPAGSGLNGSYGSSTISTNQQRGGSGISSANTQGSGYTNGTQSSGTGSTSSMSESMGSTGTMGSSAMGNGGTLGSSSQMSGSQGMAFSMPVQIAGATCDAVHLSFADANSATSKISDPSPKGRDISMMMVTITPALATGSEATSALCQISRLVNGKGSTSAIVDQLNLLIGASTASTR
jgi:hypothetical protein